MIFKLIALAFVALFIARIFFARKLSEMGKAADRTVNLFLISLAIYLGLMAIYVYAF